MKLSLEADTVITSCLIYCSISQKLATVQCTSLSLQKVDSLYRHVFKCKGIAFLHATLKKLNTEA